MDRDKRKNLELNVAIGVAVILLLAVVIVFARKAQEKTPVIKETGVKKEGAAPRPRYIIPLRTREIEEISPLEKEETATEAAEAIEEERQDIMTLQDLPLDSIAEEEMPEEKPLAEEAGEIEETRSDLQTQPSYKDMRLMKKKALIIY